MFTSLFLIYQGFTLLGAVDPYFQHLLQIRSGRETEILAKEAISYLHWWHVPITGQSNIYSVLSKQNLLIEVTARSSALDIKHSAAFHFVLAYVEVMGF